MNTVSTFVDIYHVILPVLQHDLEKYGPDLAVMSHFLPVLPNTKPPIGHLFLIILYIFYLWLFSLLDSLLQIQMHKVKNSPSKRISYIEWSWSILFDLLQTLIFSQRVILFVFSFLKPLLCSIMKILKMPKHVWF